MRQRVALVPRFLLFSLALTLALIIAAPLPAASGHAPVAQAAVPGWATCGHGPVRDVVQSGAGAHPNVDKHVLYMVYTSGGQFRSVALFPGNYEVSATRRGAAVRCAEARRQSWRQPGGDAVAADAGRGSQRTIVGALEGETAAIAP